MIIPPVPTKASSKAMHSKHGIERGLTIFGKNDMRPQLKTSWRRRHWIRAHAEMPVDLVLVTATYKVLPAFFPSCILELFFVVGKQTVWHEPSGELPFHGEWLEMKRHHFQPPSLAQQT